MPWTMSLDKIDKNSVPLAGGKAANLGEMISIKLPVPKGFVVTTDSYLAFVSENRLQQRIDGIVGGIDVEDSDNLVAASAEIQKMVMAAPIPAAIENDIVASYRALYMADELREISGKALDFIRVGRDQLPVAVRSSAVAEDSSANSFAGQMVSILNVTGPKQLLESVKRCWASLYEPRAIFYHKNSNVKMQAIAVIVQRLINADKAGVMFTADPVSSDSTKIVIEGAWGLGESVVSGSVTPDTYTYDRNTKNVEIQVNRKETMRIRDLFSGDTKSQAVLPELVETQVLSMEEISELVSLAEKIEAHYASPQDIEWCTERNKLFIVQTRPITTLKRQKVAQQDMGDKEAVLQGSPASPGLVTGSVKKIGGISEFSKLSRGDIIVAPMTTPDMVPIMKKASAIVTDTGGLTSHAAIVSRELGIPCVVGTRDATRKLHDGDIITVDATSGKIYMGVVGEPEKNPAGKASDSEKEYSTLVTATKIKVNLAFPERAHEAVNSDGIGLLRAEHMLTESGEHPMHLAKEKPDELTSMIMEKLGSIAKALHPKPVWYRSLDARTDEFKNLIGGSDEPTEANPMLGSHGIRRSLVQQEILVCELNAIKSLHEQGLTNIHLMIPFIAYVDEFTRVKQLAEQLGLPKTVKIGIMVELPSAALTIDDFCKAGIEFASFGSNDLTQLVLGVDRNNESISGLYRENNPAVLKLIEYVIGRCANYGVETSICGEAPSRDDDLVGKLVEYGISSISVELDAFDHVKEVVARKEREIVLKKSVINEYSKSGGL
ncbi:MAG: phosphoenolpyruvate synthase [Candidatus Aenigmarchaeota archaeon]|nr:phosphoenolpyruvate synthase [Candidatus Aenigmarchaeota archaeon]